MRYCYHWHKGCQLTTVEHTPAMTPPHIHTILRLSGIVGLVFKILGLFTLWCSRMYFIDPDNKKKTTNAVSRQRAPAYFHDTWLHRSFTVLNQRMNIGRLAWCSEFDSHKELYATGRVPN